MSRLTSWPARASGPVAIETRATSSGYPGGQKNASSGLSWRIEALTEAVP